MGRKFKRSSKKVAKSPVADVESDDEISVNAQVEIEEENEMPTKSTPVKQKAKKRDDSSSDEEESTKSTPVKQKAKKRDDASSDEEESVKPSEESNKNDKQTDKRPTKKKSKKKDEFEVEEIVGMEINTRWRSCPIKFRVRWVGFGEKDDTWIPVHNLNCDNFVEEFLQISGRKSEYDKAMQKFLEGTPADPNFEGYSNLRNNSRKNYNESESDEEYFVSTKTRTRMTKGPEIFNSSDNRPQLLRRPKTTGSSSRGSSSSSGSTSSSSRQNGNAVISRAEANRNQAGREYEVALIVDHRVKGRFTEYKVKWKGLPSSHDSWVPEGDLNCPKLVAQYLKAVSNEEEAEYEVASIIDSRDVDGQISYKVRWKGFSAKYDSWLPKEEMKCPELMEQFENALDKLHKKEDWVVNKVKARRVLNGEIQYLVHWSGFESKYDTWEPEDNLATCQDKVDSFLAKQQAKSMKRANDEPEEGKKGRNKSAGGGGAESKRRRLRQNLQISYTEDDDDDL